MKKSRKALLASALSLLLCFSMLLGTTFAWFTDSVTSTNNIIKSGNLDIEMEYWDGKEWKAVKEDSPLFAEDTLWEPGYTQVVYLRVANKGSLALKYQLGINIVGETTGTNVEGKTFKLSDSIYMGVVEGVDGATNAYATREAAVEAVKDDSGIISKGFNKYGDMNADANEQYLAVVVYMPTTVENEANHKTGTDAPKITLGIKLLATQKAAETDSFGSDYDNAAQHPLGDINYSATKEISADKIDTDSNNVRTLNDTVIVGSESDGIYAEIPAGVKLAAGATELKLSVQAMDESEANVELSRDETSTSLDIHVEGLAKDNATPVLVKLGRILPANLYASNVKLYHVQNGATVAMTKVATPINHNEFSYDANTGDVVVAMASFSEVFVAFNFENPWDGTADTSWYTSGTYTLTDAADLAGFAQIVGGMAEDIERDSFNGKTVTLGGNIDLSEKIWYPVGYYFTDDENDDGTTGDYYSAVYPFEGTFDGGGYTIANLRQNTWEMKGANPHYDLSENQYYNDGMGLFGYINNGTVKNLVIYGMVAEGEYTDVGCITAYARGNCTFDSIRISDVSCYSYNCRTAGIVGYDWIGDKPSNYTFTDIEIDPTCTFGALWGSWDVACAGILGYMNDTSTATFTNCNVGPVIDVYNDVCGNYQYYQYRYAGMMIGTVGKDGDPSDMTGEITFNDCTVCYGDWSNYYYCEFVKNSLASYTHDYQFSRVPKDEITFNGSGEISGCTHDHAAAGKETIDGNEVLIEDKTAVMIPFRQLYTGYGWGAVAVADGVKIQEAKYTIAYVNNGKVLDVTYILDNTIEQSVKNDAVVELANDSMAALGYEDVKFRHWMNAGSTKIETVDAGNTTNIVLYPSYEDLYTATFVDQQGNILDWTTFTKNDYTTLDNMIDEMTAPETNELIFDYWEVHVTNADGNTEVKKAWSDYLSDITFGTTDIAVYPVYTYNGDVNLIPVDNDGDGITDEYQVGGFSGGEGKDLVEIPNSVNGIPVTSIVDGALSAYDDIHAVLIPSNVEEIGTIAFADGVVTKDSILGGTYEGEGRETVTLYYQGDKDSWGNITKTDGWDDNLGDGSRVFFLDANGKVINTMYWELNDDWEWVLHEHAYTYEAAQNCSHGADSHYEYGGGIFGYGDSLQEDEFTDYAGTCDCDSCNGATRPDAEYWNTSTTA